MTLAAILLILTGSPQVLHLPAISDSCDVLVVMMEDGLLPLEPWEGISEVQREEFWTWACRGMLVERSGWSGYIILAPPGSGEELLGAAEALASTPGAVISSDWREAMGITPLSDCPSTVILYTPDGSDPAPASLPLTGSLWLEGPPDTLVVESDLPGSTFFWTGLPDAASLYRCAWRGTGTEVVPVGEGSVRMAYSSSLGRVPSNLSAVSPAPHQMDDTFMNSWGAALVAVDSLIEGIHPAQEGAGHLLWIRGEGDGTVPPYRTAPSPPAPASVLVQVGMPEGWTGVAMPPRGDPSTIPGIVRVELPGIPGNQVAAPVISAALERILASSVIPILGFDVLFDITASAGSGITVWLASPDGSDLPDGAGDTLLESLYQAMLLPSGEMLIVNSAVRASLLTGSVIQAPPHNEAARDLMLFVGSTGYN